MEKWGMYIRQVAIFKKCPPQRDRGGKYEKIPQDLRTVKKWYFYKIVVYHTAKALPFGEGAPVGGGRGAVQSFIFSIAFGEFVMR